MPLMKPPNFNGRELPYDIKLQMVEQNCAECPFLVKRLARHSDIEVELEFIRDEEWTYGCSFQQDMKLFNLMIREHYLTIVEIASNTCEFWTYWLKWELEKIDATPGDWEDFCAQPSKINFIVDMPIIPEGGFIEYKPGHLQEAIQTTQQIIVPKLHFSEDCGVRY